MPLCLVVLAVVMVMNLRGLGRGVHSSCPRCSLSSAYLSIVIGLVHPLAPHLHQPGKPVFPKGPLEAVGVVLVLKAFAAGCSALTGVE